MHNDQILGGDVVSGGGIVIENQVAGDMIYYDGNAWVRVPKGIAAQVLTMGSEVPQWSGLPGYPKYYPRFVPISVLGGLRGGVQNDVGDVYLGVYGGGIYKMAGGIGTPEIYQAETENWRGGCSLGDDVYLCSGATGVGKIFKMTGGSGSFVDLSQTGRVWNGMCTDGNHVYASDLNGKLYKQTNATGDFIEIPGVTSRAWGDMTAKGSDLYILTIGGSGLIYYMENATGDPVDSGIVGTPTTYYTGIEWNPDKSELYIAENDGPVFVSVGAVDTAVDMYTGGRKWDDLFYNSTNKKLWTVDLYVDKILTMDLSYD